MHSFETAVPAVSKVMLLQILYPSICLHLTMESLVQRCRGSGLSSLHDSHSLGYPSKYGDIHNVGIQLLTHMHAIIQHNVCSAWYIDSSVYVYVSITIIININACMHTYDIMTSSYTSNNNTNCGPFTSCYIFLSLTCSWGSHPWRANPPNCWTALTGHSWVTEWGEQVKGSLPGILHVML